MSKILSQLLYKVPLEETSGDMNLLVEGLTFDSRKATSGMVFIAIQGTQTDGHDFIRQAIATGAIAIVYQNDLVEKQPGLTYIRVKDSAFALGQMAAHFFDNPSEKLIVVGVTGTNGKTTTVTLLYQLFRKMGYGTGMLSTVQNWINETAYPSTHTTPDPIQLQSMMAQMLLAGCTHCFMEVSSHALVQQRVAGINFAGAVFTNISHDHLDFHQTFDNYIAAKKLLFDHLPTKAFALTNIDDKRGMVMVQNCKASLHTYALLKDAAFRTRFLSHTLQGMELEIEGQPVWFTLTGKFNAYNLLCVYAVARLLGLEAEETLTQLSIVKPAPGRFELITDRAMQRFAIVDYAHTPDALQNVLETIAELRTRNEQVITVVGCGGNRDKAKRPVMASIACAFSDKVIFTSDNPRDENPDEILDEMMAGVSPTEYRKVLRISDRREAIRTAFMMSGKGDIILIAGKGHENYQEVKGVKHPFDDRAIARELMNETETN
jgi:UDP-N-acetylmuramoyl-L-alanyl-D-glutamate--2,6-diaminopimelate ligase